MWHNIEFLVSCLLNAFVGIVSIWVIIIGTLLRMLRVFGRVGCSMWDESYRICLCLVLLGVAWTLQGFQSEHIRFDDPGPIRIARFQQCIDLCYYLYPEGPSPWDGVQWHRICIESCFDDLWRRLGPTTYWP